MNSIWLALIFAIGVAGAVAFVLLRARRLHHESLVLNEEIKKWEDEGGNVPPGSTQSGS